MKLMIKLMVLALIGAVVAPMLIKGPDGRPLMSWQDFFSSPSKPSGTGVSSSSGLTTVYKWQDDEGNWHFSDRPVVESSEKLTYNPNANIIQSLAKKEEPQKVKVTPFESTPDQKGPSLTTVPMDQVPELMDQAKQYQSLIDQRNEALEQFNKR